MIADHSISRHKAQRQLCISSANELRNLLAERDELLAEVNQWRSAAGVPLVPRKARSIGQHLEKLLKLEHETFGTFPNGFGDNPTADEADNHGSTDMDHATLDEVEPQTQALDGTLSRDGPHQPITAGSNMHLQNTPLGVVSNLPTSTSIETVGTNNFDLDDFLSMTTSHECAPPSADIDRTNFTGMHRESLSSMNRDLNINEQHDALSQYGFQISEDLSSSAIAFDGSIYNTINNVYERYTNGGTQHLQSAFTV